VIAGIILAAGASSRMGTPKALLDYRGATFVRRLFRVLGETCQPVMVVLGYHADVIRQQVPLTATIVVNPDPSRGQLSSLQTALGRSGWLLPPTFPGPLPDGAATGSMKTEPVNQSLGPAAVSSVFRVICMRVSSRGFRYMWSDFCMWSAFSITASVRA